MHNKAISNLLEETADLLDLHQENEFRSKAIRSSAFAVSKIEQGLCGLSLDEIASFKGVGKSTATKILEICATGDFQEHLELISKTPAGILELFDIKGLGPKKIALLWKGLGVESPGELLYACNENRLVSLKGFGEKTQAEIKKNLEFKASQKGFFHYAQAEAYADSFISVLKSNNFNHDLSFVGDFRRKCEVVKQIDLFTKASYNDFLSVLEKLNEAGFQFLHNDDTQSKFNSSGGPELVIHHDGENHVWSVFNLTGPELHVSGVKSKLGIENPENQIWADEKAIYFAAGLSFIEPEMRDLDGFVSASWKIVDNDDLKGCLHNHSTYSDGASTLKEMANACKAQGLQYFAICDHSKSAFYAGGLKEEDVIRQHIEIDQLNKELKPFVILKGIESDVLTDGSLDYSDEVLASFDVVVASIHSGLKMDEEKATARIIKAVENPYTTILGHPTGRLLLSRQGYPLDHRKVIDACAANGVAIELNAHPYRLDIDWRWLNAAIEKGVFISINPDAHHIDGIRDMRFGVNVARKAGIGAHHVLNAMDLNAFMSWLSNRKMS
ncbi:MAG: helix-hairpin-helix domain-containing protein [Bacteroidota bacterium]